MTGAPGTISLRIMPYIMTSKYSLDFMKDDLFALEKVAQATGSRCQDVAAFFQLNLLGHGFGTSIDGAVGNKGKMMLKVG